MPMKIHLAYGLMRPYVENDFTDFQGGHIRAKIKFPVFSLSFPCVMIFFPVFFSIKLIDGFE